MKMILLAIFASVLLLPAIAAERVYVNVDLGWGASGVERYCGELQRKVKKQLDDATTKLGVKETGSVFTQVTRCSHPIPSTHDTRRACGCKIEITLQSEDFSLSKKHTFSSSKVRKKYSSKEYKKAKEHYETQMEKDSTVLAKLYDTTHGIFENKVRFHVQIVEIVEN